MLDWNLLIECFMLFIFCNSDGMVGGGCGLLIGVGYVVCCEVCVECGE